MTEEITVREMDGVVAPVVAQANSITIATSEDYQGAGEFLKAIKGAQKTVKDHFGPMKTAAHAAWKKITTTEADTLVPLDNAERTVKRIMVKWATEQESIRQEEQMRLQAKADEEARRERERLEKEAAKLKTPELKEARMEAAAQVVAPVVQVASAAPVIKGQSITKRWKARIDDPKAAAMALVQFVDWKAYIKINTAELDRFASRTKGGVKLDGVTFFEEASLSSGSR